MNLSLLTFILALTFVQLQSFAATNATNARKNKRNLAIDSTQIVIEQIRAKLMVNLKANDKVAVREILNDLERFDTTKYLSNYFIERVLIHFYLNNEEEFVSEFIDSENLIQTKYNPALKIVPQRDSLYPILAQQLVTTQKTNFDGIDSTAQNDEKKFFKELCGKYIYFNICSKTETENSLIYFRNQLNLFSESFVRQYPNSIYGKFVKDKIHVKMQSSSFGWDFEAYCAGGAYSGSVSTGLSSFGQIGLGINLTQNRLFFIFRNNIGLLNSVKYYDNSSNIFNSEKQTNGLIVYYPEIGFGFYVAQNKDFNVIPHICYSTLYVFDEHTITTGSNYYSATTKTHTYTFSFGINFDIKLNSKKQTNEIYAERYKSANDDHHQIRIRPSIIVGNYENTTESLFLLSAGWSGFNRKLKRVKLP